VIIKEKIIKHATNTNLKPMQSRLFSLSINI
jgi:hypothetical protein